MIERRNLLAQLTNICDDVEIDTDLLLHGSNTLISESNSEIFVLVAQYIHDTGRVS